MRWAGPNKWDDPPRWYDFYPTFMWNLLSHFKKFFVLLEKDRFDYVVLGGIFFSMSLSEGCSNSILLYKIIWIFCNFLELYLYG